MSIQFILHYINKYMKNVHEHKPDGGAPPCTAATAAVVVVVAVGQK